MLERLDGLCDCADHVSTLSGHFKKGSRCAHRQEPSPALTKSLSQCLKWRGSRCCCLHILGFNATRQCKRFTCSAQTERNIKQVSGKEERVGGKVRGKPESRRAVCAVR